MVEAIKKKLLDKGGTKEDWDYALTLGVSPSDQGWVDGKVMKDEALGFAQRVMEQGMMIEYECYDARGGPQGKAVLRLKDWLEYGSGLLKGEHQVASDPYYEWYGTQLQEDNAVYHVCSGSRRSCRVRLPRGDRREFIHLERWRVATPMALMAADYSAELGKRLLEEWVSNYTPRVPEPAGLPSGGKGKGVGHRDPTGADEALRAVEAATAAAVEVERVAPGSSKDQAKRRAPSARGSVGELLSKKAEEHKAAKRKKDEEKRDRQRGRSRSRGRRRRRKGDADEDKSPESSRSRSSGSSPGFQRPSARGEAEMWRLSQRNPGSLLRKAIKEMQRYLAARAEGGEDGMESDWTNSRMLSYINQVVLVQHPPASIGIRNQRELITLGTAVDLLLGGKLGELGDLLVQRIKALETSFSDAGWATARHQELIPPQGASLTTEDERRKAARMELATVKLKEAVMKNRGANK
eukprot:Skav208184  [mRNA]  locus=scaffold2530:366794:368191:+ [translate_table: standard]